MKISKISLHNGLFLGVILVVFTISLSYANPSVFFRSRSFLLSIPFILILIKAGTEFRKSNDGIASFKELFKVCFFCAAIAISLCTLFEYMLFNYINPNLTELEKSVNLEALESSKVLFSEEYIEQHKSYIEENNMHSLSQTFTFLATRLFSPAALFSLMVALIFKRKTKITYNNKL